MSNLHEIPGLREMKLPERARWGTFCAMEQQACDLLVTASRMLAGAEQAGAAGNAAVAIRDGKILETGSAAELETRWKPAARRDLGNVLLMPGLVNAHTHVPMTFLRGFADDLPLMEWLTGHIFPVEGRLTDRIVSLGARLGMYEMMRTGTTAFVDSYLLEINVLREVERMGMRCVGGEALFAFIGRRCTRRARSGLIFYRSFPRGDEQAPGNAGRRCEAKAGTGFYRRDPTMFRCRSVRGNRGRAVCLHSGVR